MHAERERGADVGVDALLGEVASSASYEASALGQRAAGSSCSSVQWDSSKVVRCESPSGTADRKTSVHQQSGTGYET